MSNGPDQQRDFSLRPLPQTPAQPNARPPDATRTETPSPQAAPSFSGGASSDDMVIAGAIVLVLAIVFFFVRGGVRRHLIAGRASMSAAGNAGWAVFAFLLSASATVVFGLFGHLWTTLAFTVPMAGVVLMTFVLSIILYATAARGRR